MKKYLLFFSILACTFMYGQHNYTITIDGLVQEIALDTEYQITVKGKKHTVKVTAKDTVTYQGKLFSFKHSKDYKVTKTAIDFGIDQQMIMAADGTGIAIQQYHYYDPTMLNEIMMTEVTKESLSYGYEMEREDYERKLSSGHDITVNRAVLRYKGDINIYEIASVGNKDEGIIVLTMKMNDNRDSEGQKIIDTMWETLKYQ